MPEHIASIAARCGEVNETIQISVISFIVTIITIIFTILPNTAIIYCLVKERKTRYKSLFYKLLLNIAIADLMKGAIADTLAVNMLRKELVHQDVTIFEIYATHIMIFSTDSTALVTLTILCIERIMGLVYPIKHRIGMKPRNENILVIGIWPISFLLVVPYYKLQFIKHLAVFTTLNISICSLSLLLTTVFYYFRFYTNDIIKKRLEGGETLKTSNSSNKNIKVKFCSVKTQEISSCNKVDDDGFITTIRNPLPTATKDGIISVQSAVNILMEQHGHNKTKYVTYTHFERTKHSSSENLLKRSTQTFLYMLCVFGISYLPTCLSMMYMNTCSDCDCHVVHIMRDASLMGILSSSVFRPLSFIWTLKHLKNSVSKFFKSKSVNAF